MVLITLIGTFSVGVAMGMIVPKVRKHLCADALFGSVLTAFADIPDPRKGDTDISLTDALMSAFAMFSRKSPSLLAFDGYPRKAGHFIISTT